MGGFDWAALEVVVEELGVRDVSRLIRLLAQIRDHQNGGGANGGQ